MNKTLLNKAYQDYINAHLNSNIQSLVLNPKIDTPFDFKELIEQIEAKKKSQNKLPTWFNTPQIYYPNKLNIEQTSSELTAEYKSHLLSGDLMVDITGGFGVDTFYFSKVINKVYHCEISKSLSEITTYNFKQLGIKNVSTIVADGLQFLKESHLNFDWIYIDPSRRHNLKGKVFYLKDCLPDVTQHLRLLFKKTNRILIKTSPLLDISIGVSELKYIKEIHVVAIQNEVKELLWVLEKDFSKKIKVKTINITTNSNQYFDFYLDEEKDTTAQWHLPENYLYEPNAAILKSGAFNIISKEFQVYKLHKSSHLYSSATLLKDFPGRVFVINKILPYTKQNLKHINIKKANITTRNFSESVSDIRKKFKIKDGGNIYLFFTTNINNERIVLQCEKI